MSDDNDDIKPLFPRDESPANVVGAIAPAVVGEPEARALFTIKEHSPWRPSTDCPHMHYTIDPRWQTVECADCGARLEAFAILQRYAEWYVKLQQEIAAAEWQRISVIRHQLRAIKDRVALSDDDRQEIHRAIHWTGKDTTSKALGELLRRMERKIDDAKDAKYEKRRRSRT